MATRKTIACLSLLLCLTAGIACRKKEGVAIAVVPKGQAHIFWQTVHAGAVAAGRDLGVEVLWNGPASEIDFTRQINVVDDFINRRVDGIAPAPSNEDFLAPIFERAWQDGIPVTIFDSGIRTGKYLSYVSTDNMGLLGNGCNLLGIFPFVQQVLIGAVIVLAVTFDEYQRSRNAFC